MKNICVGTLFLLCIVPVLLWPMEESLHPLPASLAEEGFEVAGRHPRAVSSTPATATTTSRKSSTKSPVIPTQRKGSSATHHTGPTLTPAHPSQPKATKKAKLNRPTKPGKKYTPRHHQQKKHKKLTDTKVKQSDKPNSKPHLKNEKPKNNGAIH
uniref:Uncharacterized protein n=1 Tax=Daphnia galeata TaxID=27404 RepID=A0A8J2RMH1_9CRUS|nr:unnamed protein product [Daphnia galeata]